MTKKTMLAVMLLISKGAFALNNFECEIRKVYKLTEQGSLKEGKGFVTPDIGDKFVVNGQTGQITGKNITNTMSGIMPTVYNNLPKENALRVVTVYPHTIDYLQINTYQESIEKSFIYKGAFGEVITGVCNVI